MKRFWVMAVALVVLGGMVRADGKVDVEKEKAFVVGKVNDVVKLIDEKGLEETIKAVNDVEGEFHWGSDYVFILDIEGNTIAHPTHVGINVLGLRCPVNGNPFFAETMEKATKDENAEGWLEYYWSKPDGKGGFYEDEDGNRKPFKKMVYYKRKGDVIVFAGFYVE